MYQNWVLFIDFDLFLHFQQILFKKYKMHSSHVSKYTKFIAFCLTIIGSCPKYNETSYVLVKMYIFTTQLCKNRSQIISDKSVVAFSTFYWHKKLVYMKLICQDGSYCHCLFLQILDFAQNEAWQVFKASSFCPRTYVNI